jgi:membrane protease YdiL (CAAX protease family)
MADPRTPDEGTSDVRSSDASAKKLSREAISLAAILGVSLALSSFETGWLTKWQGYPSSLLLLFLAWWYKRRFGIAVAFLPRRSVGRLFPIVFPLVLIFLLLLVGQKSVELQASPTPPVPQLLHLLLLVPLSEEFFFRGLLLDHLRRGLSTVGAIVLCTVLFAVLHLPVGSPILIGLLSLVACLLVLFSGGWGYAFQLHVAYNGLSQIHRIDDDSTRWAWALLASAVIVGLSLALRLGSKGRSTGDSTA